MKKIQLKPTSTGLGYVTILAVALLLSKNRAIAASSVTRTPIFIDES